MSARPTWLRHVLESALLEPLLDTRLSADSLLRVGRRRRPRAVLVGVGLCTQTQLSRAVPFDLLGMLLPAERIRRAAGADQLIALVADRHPLANGFDETSIQRCARVAEGVLGRVRDLCELEAMSIVRASSFHDAPAYTAIAEETRRRAPTHHEYEILQLADAAYLDRTSGGLLKLGWALGGSSSAQYHLRDELAFDRLYRACYGDDVGFIYTKPGRSFADRSPKVAPYIAADPRLRMCLDRREAPESKFESALRAASRETVNGYRRHLKAILYTFGRYVGRLPRGGLEDRLRYVIDGAGSSGAREARAASAPPVELANTAS